MKNPSIYSPALVKFQRNSNPPCSAPTRLRFAFARRWVALWLTLLGLAVTPSSQAQNIFDCSCLSTQSILFTNACSGFIPDLCPVATNCYFPTAGSVPGYTCLQFPPAGTPVSVCTPITFIFTETATGISVVCNVTFCPGISTNVFTLLCQPGFTVPCGTTSWPTNAPGWTNTCCTFGMTTNLTFMTNWPVISSVWTIIDGCGQSASCTQTVTFVGPCVTNCLQIICPPDILVQTCLPPFPQPGIFTNISYPFPTVINNCIGVITNITCTPPSGSPFLVGTNPVVCTVLDNMGNSASCTFNVIVLGDTDPPNIVCGPNQTVQCQSAWSPIPPLANDVCCGASGTTVMLQNAITNSSPPCLETIEFWWHVFDCNGNATNCTNYVTIVDTTPPVIFCNSNQTYNCSGTAIGAGWQPVPPAAFDLCCGPIPPLITLLNSITNGGQCTQTVTLTWRAEDCCTNFAYCTEVITLIDTNPPIMNCAPLKIVECGSGWTFDPPVAFDACCGTNVVINIASNLTIFSSTCSNVYRRFWTATDCCTNVSVCSQRVVEVDRTPPNVNCPPSVTINCGAPLVFTTPTAFDACCGASVSIVATNTSTNTLVCPYSVTRDWLITDCCGNVTNCSQTIHVVDNVPPVITCPPNQTVSCGSTWVLGTATATDACCGSSGVNVFLQSLTTNSSPPCIEVVTAVWEATDCCQNKSFCTNTVTVVDTTPPIISCNSNQTYSCSGTAPGSGWQPVPPTAIDLCCGPIPPTVSLLASFTNGTVCTMFITNIWAATDCCTNTAYCTEVVTLVDTNPPVITCAPPFKVVECGTSWTFDTPTAMDACCGTNVTINVASNVTVISGTCLSIFDRFWTATDCCTNVSVCNQRVIVQDTLPPAVTFCPPGGTVQCGSPLVFGVPTAVDLCCGALVTISAPVITTNAISNCSRDIKATWTITDCCGNSTNCTQAFIVVDTIPPVITCAPNVTIACGSAFPLVPATATDNCCLPSTGAVSLIGTFTNLSGCTTTVGVVWRAVDCCSNISRCTNFVTYVDTTPPVITCSTTIPVVQCGSPIVPPPATDLCCPSVSVSLLTSITNVVNSCRYFVTNTWQAVDCCTNTATCTETIMITDTTPPVPNCAPNKTVECGSVWSFDPPTPFDACCGTNVTVTVLFTTPPFGTACAHLAGYGLLHQLGDMQSDRDHRGHHAAGDFLRAKSNSSVRVDLGLAHPNSVRPVLCAREHHAHGFQRHHRCEWVHHHVRPDLHRYRLLRQFLDLRADHDHRGYNAADHHLCAELQRSGGNAVEFHHPHSR
jgi:hypothetical protein